MAQLGVKNPLSVSKKQRKDSIKAIKKITKAVE